MVNKFYYIAGALIIFLPLMAYLLLCNKEVDSAQKMSDNLNFINPAVRANLGKHYIINFQELRNTFLNITKGYSGQGYVYFSYLNNGAWVGIRERDMITAASTVKVPLAMAVYKGIEDGKFTGDEEYVIQEEDLNAAFGNLYKGGVGQVVTLKELVKVLLEYSDNTASNAIVDIFKRVGIDNPLEKVYAAMGWEIVGNIGEVPTYGLIHLKILSNMFSALYNATYLNPEHSQILLSYLANTPFNTKIDAGVPSGIEVAHKIGVYAEGDTYSDCGIVYAPNRNYLLCVGMVGEREDIAAEFMAKISSAAYRYVINN